MTAAKKKKAKAPAKPKRKASSAKAEAARRRTLFIEAMITTEGNQTESAKRAGFSKRTAYSQGHALMKHPEIVKGLAARRQALAAKFEITNENILRELGRIAYFDPKHCFDEKGELKNIHLIDEDTRRAIASVEEGKIRAFSKSDAVKTAMQYLNLMPRRGVNVVATAQSAAAAEVSMVQADKLTDFEKARRIAYAMTKMAPPTTDSSKEPA